MIEKTKNVLTIILGLFIVFTIIYSAIRWGISMFDEPELISSDEVQLYLIEANQIKEYGLYYYLEDCLDNLVEATKRNEYDKLYNIYIKDYKEVYTKEEVYAKLKEFSINNSQHKLKNVYSAKGLYILEYELNGNTEYMFMQTGADKDVSYNFAIIK